MFEWLKIPVKLSKGAETRLLERASKEGKTAEAVVSELVEKCVSRAWKSWRDMKRRHIRKLRKR